LKSYFKRNKINYKGSSTLWTNSDLTADKKRIQRKHTQMRFSGAMQLKSLFLELQGEQSKQRKIAPLVF
jgi:hypothetical protein